MVINTSKRIKVKEAMVEEVVTITKDKNIRECGELMKQEDVGSLLVLENDSVIGLITATDLVREIIAKDLKPTKIKISDVMTTHLHTISPNKNLLDATKILLKKNIKRLPVVENGELVGLISYKDILKITPELNDFLLRKVEEEEIEEKFGKEITEEEVEENICEICGNYSEDLEMIDGQWVCEECREESSMV